MNSQDIAVRTAYLEVVDYLKTLSETNRSEAEDTGLPRLADWHNTRADCYQFACEILEAFMSEAVRDLGTKGTEE